MLTKIVDKDGTVSYFDASQINLINTLNKDEPASTIQRSDKPKDQPLVWSAAQTFIYLATGWKSIKDDNR